MSQTAVNDMGGATSPVALIVTSGAIALTLLFFASFFHNLPEPVLGAIVLMAASHLVRFEELRRLLIQSRAAFWTSMVACVGVLFFGLLNGLLLAAVGSLVMLIAQTSRPMVVVVGRERSTGHFVSRARNPDASDTPGALVVRSASTWLYFNAEHIRRQIVDMIDGTPAGIRTVVLDFSSVPAIDITAGTSAASAGQNPERPRHQDRTCRAARGCRNTENYRRGARSAVVAHRTSGCCADVGF